MKIGERLPDLHLQIASLALAHDLPLVTQDQHHFARLADVASLALDDWLSDERIA